MTFDSALPAGTSPAGDQSDDLHLLMATAILCGQRGVEAWLLPIFDAWAHEYPQDALAGIGRGLYLLGQGDPEGAFATIREAARNSTTRADQARDVLDSLAADLPQYAG